MNCSKSLKRITFQNRMFVRQAVRRDAIGRREYTQEKIINDVLLDAKFCKKKAAQMLGISRTTLWRKMKTLT